MKAGKVIKTEFFHFDRIEKFFTGADLRDAFQTISDRVFRDLDLEDVFRLADRTCSRPGQQYLYYMMRCIPATRERARRMEHTIAVVEKEAWLRHSVSDELSKLDNHDAYNLPSLFQGKYISKPRWLWLIQLLCGVSVLSILLSFFFPKFLIALVVLCPVNMGIHYWNKNNIYQYSGSIPQLLLMNQVAGRILSNTAFQEYATVSGAVDSLAKLFPHMSLFKIEAKIQSEIGQLVDYLLELVKALLLLEPVVLFATLEKLDRKRKEIAAVFTFVGEIDAALSILNLRESIPYYCTMPLVAGQCGISAKGVYHPLLFHGVANDILLKDKSALLTGSNMSGKTTFIRTIGINAILGQTINTCFAKEFKMPLMRVESSIRIADDLLEDKSYYMEEVFTLKHLIDNCRGGNKALILLDEIFKGTNSNERIAIGKSVLSYLARNGNLVFVSTHDRELTDLLADDYELYHFTEVIENEQIVFDYKIKPGVLDTTNAIRILALHQFPSEIIEEANRLSSQTGGAR